MTTKMKISKRDVMNRAWNIFRSGKYSKRFSDCLRRAWEVEKENVLYRAQQAKAKEWGQHSEETSENSYQSYDYSKNPVAVESMIAYYNRSGAYVGD